MKQILQNISDYLLLPLSEGSNPDEVADVSWVDIDVLKSEIALRPGEFTPWLRIYLAEHSAMIFGETATV